MKTLAIIGAQRMAKNYAINAREMGVETFCFAWPKGAVAKDFVDHFYPISIFEIEQIVEVCRREKIDGVVSTSELTISVAAKVAAELGLNGIPVEIARTITDKYRNREASRNVEGLHHPKFAKVRAPDDVAAKGLSYPIILKPTAEGGKRGISVVNSLDELANAFAYAHGESKNGAEFIAEEFIAGGKEYSVETLSYCGKHIVIQVTEKISSGPPHCVELGHIQPARISDAIRYKISDVISRALTAIGYSNGPCHTEIKIVDDEIWLIEFNARPGGDFISYPLCDLSTGYGYLKGAIQIALDEFCFPADSDFVQSAAGVCFVTEQTKWLKPVFDICESKSWCWRKNDVGDILSLSHNDCDGTNYFIWECNHGFPDELVDFGALNSVEISQVTSIGDQGITLKDFDRLLDGVPGMAIVGEALHGQLSKMLALGRLLVARVNDEVCGLIGFYANDKDARMAHIIYLSVDAKMRGRGIGRGLIQESLRLSKLAGMTSAELLVRYDNSKAKDLYSMLGFRQRGYGRTPEMIRMQIRL